jgi:glutathione S-transferase
MKLYSANLSPFASRARMAIYAKGLPVEIGLPETGLKSPEYLAINPMGKLPCFAGPDGLAVPESEVILEYLEDAFPEPSLRPVSPEDKARVRLISRIAELYVAAPGGPLFGQMDPSKRDPEVVEAAMKTLHQGLAWLDSHLTGGAYAFGKSLTTADCTLVPTLFWLKVFAQAFDRPDLLDDHPKVKAYAEAILKHPAAAKVTAELGGAARHYRETGQIS